VPTAAWAERYSSDFEPAMRFLDDSSKAFEASRRRQRWILYALGSVAALVVILVGVLLWYRNVEQSDRIVQQNRFKARLEGLATQANDTIQSLEEDREVQALETADLLKEVDRLHGAVEAAASGPPQGAPGTTTAHQELQDLQRELKNFDAYVSKSDTKFTEQKLKTDSRIESYNRERAAVWRPSAEEVKWLQGRLNEVAGTALEVNGVLGKDTSRALMALQASHDLSPDGILGPATRALLEKLPERPQTQEPPAEKVPQAVITLVASQLDVAPDELDMTLSLDEIGLDRKRRAAIAGSVEHRFGVTIPDEALGRLRSLGDLVAFVEDPEGWQPSSESTQVPPPTATAAQQRCREVEVREMRSAAIPEWGVLLSAGEIEDLYVEDLEVRLGMELGRMTASADFQRLVIGADRYRLRLVDAIDRGLGKPDTAEFEICLVRDDCSRVKVNEDRSVVLKEWQLQIAVGEVEKKRAEGVEIADLAVWRGERLAEGERREFRLRGRRYSITLDHGHDIGSGGPAVRKRSYRRDFASLKFCRLDG